jgi:hypothetical protein
MAAEGWGVSTVTPEDLTLRGSYTVPLPPRARIGHMVLGRELEPLFFFFFFAGVGFELWALHLQSRTSTA